ncbi:MAG: LapA family protein [Candidatus Pacebacteria bacterium]|nr:LapA family protein [Candidatus Paceibacterota bacterium]
MSLFSIILSLIIAILTLIFDIQNTNQVSVRFLVWRVEGSFALILLSSFISGFTVSLLVLLPKMIRKSLLISKQKKDNEVLERKLVEEVKNNLPKDDNLPKENNII